ncbi:hypothetical protein [Bradyrhizobium sp. URHC0002]
MRRRDDELQADPQLAEGPATRKARNVCIAIAVVLGAVFYGLNNSSVNQTGTTSPTQAAQQTQPANPAAPLGTRDVTPGANTEPGTTTGAVTTNRPTPPSPNPTGTELDHSKQ